MFLIDMNLININIFFSPLFIIKVYFLLLLKLFEFLITNCNLEQVAEMIYLELKFHCNKQF